MPDEEYQFGGIVGRRKKGGSETFFDPAPKEVTTRPRRSSGPRKSYQRELFRQPEPGLSIEETIYKRTVNPDRPPPTRHSRFLSACHKGLHRIGYTDKQIYDFAVLCRADDETLAKIRTLLGLKE